MKCPNPNCKKNMLVTQTYAVTGGKTQRLACECGWTACAVTIIAVENPGYGKGASTMAKKLAAGDLNVVITDKKA